MKKIIPVLLCLFALQSCRDKETVYIETPVVSQPERQEKDEKGTTSKNSEQGKSSLENQREISETEGLKIHCELDQCNDSIGYIKHNNLLCQTVQVDENIVYVSKTCLKITEEKLLDCSDIVFQSKLDDSKCSKVIDKDGYYSLVLNKRLKSDPIKVYNSDQEGVNLIQSIHHIENDKIIFGESECNIDFDSINHLDANSFNSNFFYSRSCRGDFIFKNEALIGVKVQEDKNGTRYINLKCLNTYCDGEVSVDQKVKDLFYKTDLGKTAKYDFENIEEYNRYNSTKSIFEVTPVGLLIKREILCIKLKEFKSTTREDILIPLRVSSDGRVNFDFDNVSFPKRSMFVRYHYKRNPIFINSRCYNIYDQEVCTDDYNGNFHNYTDMFSLMRKLDVYEHNETFTYETFLKDIFSENLVKYKKYEVPQCN